MTLQCYICHSTNDLTVRNTNHERKIYMCKPCRRKEYPSIEEVLSTPVIDPDEWAARYLEKHQKLLQHPGNVRVPVRSQG